MNSYRHRVAEFISEQVLNAPIGSPLENCFVQFSNRENKLEGMELAPNNQVVIACNKAQGNFYGKGCSTTPGRAVADSNQVKVVVGFFLTLDKRKDDVTPIEQENATEKVWSVMEAVADAVFNNYTLGDRVKDAKATKWFEDSDNLRTRVTTEAYLLIEMNTTISAGNIR